MTKKESARSAWSRNRVLLLILLIAIILRNFLCQLAASVFVPVFKDIDPKWINMVCIWLTILLLYIYAGRKIASERIIVTQRTIILLFSCVLFFSVFRFCDEYEFKSLPGFFTIVDASFGFALMCEFVCICYKANRLSKTKKIASQIPQFHADFPSKEDKFNRTQFAKVLVEKINSTFTHEQVIEGSFNILLNEHYGMGKSSFLNVIKDECKKVGIEFISITPWTVSGKNNITKYFLDTLASHYGAGESKLKHLIIDYAGQLCERINPTFWNSISSAIKKELTVYDLSKEIKAILLEVNRPLVVFIDDVDRLQQEELETVLNLIRNTADFPNIVYIVAADKTALVDVLSSSGIHDPNLFLQKFFNFELLFPADDGNLMFLLMKEVSSVFDSHGISVLYRPDILSSFSGIKYLHEIFRSPRDVYRYSNLLSFDLDIHVENNTSDELYIPDLLKLLIIKYLDCRVYKILRDYPDYLLSFNPVQCRYDIKKECNTILSRDIRSRINQIKPHENQSPATNDTTSQDTLVTDIHGAINDATPTPAKIVGDLLYDLFLDSTHLNSLCYESEYFKYFAGNYSKTQIPYKEARDIFCFQTIGEYQNSVLNILDTDKEDSFVHQIKRTVGDTGHINFVDVCEKLVFLFNAMFTKDSQTLRFPDKINYFNGSQIQYIVQDIFMYHENNRRKYEPIQLAEFETYLGKVNEIDTVALFLWTCRFGEPYYFIFGADMLVKFNNMIRQRFVAERMKVNPFDSENIKIIPIIKRLNEIEWEECMIELIHKSNDPLEWLYRIIINNGNKLEWNYNYFNNVFGEYSYFADIANKYFSGLIPPEIEQDLIVLKYINNSKALQADEQIKHPFIVAAKNWLKSKE